jgi:excisionase family DNA binding protein
VTFNDCFSGVSRLDFFSIELATWLREELSSKVPAKESVGVLTYDRTYRDIYVLVEVLQEVYAVYLKDYNFGHIKPLGECVYMLDEQDAVESDEAYLYAQVLPDLSNRISNGEINLDKELYDYYHTLPDEYIPFIEKNLSDHITVAEAAKILGVSDARIKKMVEDRVLDGFKRDKRVYLSKADVEQRKVYIEQHGKPTKNKTV